MQNTVQVLLLTGPAGVGKSTLCWEIALHLERANVPHVVIETDELDRVFPKPTADDLESLWPGTTDVSAVNLAALWSTYRALGHSRLIMTGVMLNPDLDRSWITAAIPDSNLTFIRLMASEATLIDRLSVREIGSGAEAQIQRTLGQVQAMARENDPGLLRLPTDGEEPEKLAATVLREVGWLSR